MEPPFNQPVSHVNLQNHIFGSDSSSRCFVSVCLTISLQAHDPLSLRAIILLEPKLHRLVNRIEYTGCI